MPNRTSTEKLLGVDLGSAVIALFDFLPHRGHLTQRAGKPNLNAGRSAVTPNLARRHEATVPAREASID